MRSILVILVMLFINSGYSQEFVSRNITQQNNLPSNTVYDIFQDSKGFVWMATENGLTRYNGIHFKSYENTAIRSQSMSHIIEDSKGRIWLHNFFGEILFVENDKLKKLFSWEKYYKSGFPSLHQFGDTITINSYENFYYYNIVNEEWSELFIQPEKPNEKINVEHHIIANSTIWLAYYSGERFFVSSIKEPKTKIEIDIPENKVFKNNWRLIHWNNSILLFDHVNSRLLKIENNEVKDLTDQFSKALKETREIRVLGNNDLAFIGPKGCFLKREGKAIIQIAKGKNVSCILSDNEGAYWIGTLNEGVFYYPTLYSTIYTGAYTKLESDKVNKKVIAGGYDGSLSVISFDGMLENVIPPNYPKEIQSLLIDENNNSILYYGLQLYQLTLEDFKSKGKFSIASAKSIFKINDYYGIATSAGFYTLNPADGTRKNLVSNIRLSSAVYNENTHTTWLGSQKGVLQLDMPSGKLSEWKPDDSEYSPGISKAIIDNNFIALGSYTNGVYLIQGDQLYEHLTKEVGLISNRITALKMRYPNVYIGTDQGLNIYNIETKEFDIINQEKGLMGNEIHDITLSHEDIWISHVSGLQRIQGAIPENKIPPKVYVNRAKSGEDLLTISSNGIILPPDKRQLEIEFDVANNFRSHGKTKIYYRINGLDNRWNQTNLSSPTVNYLSLPSGEYTIEGYAINEDGVNSENRISIPLVVVAPFWETSWFLALLIFFSMLIVGILVYTRLKIVNRKKLEIAEKLANEQELRIAQLTSIRAQMNPHFIFNTMSLIQSKVVSGMKEKASSTINDFSSLMRKVLDFSSRELISLQEEVEVLEKFLAIEKERFENELEYTITIDVNLQHELVKIPSLLTQPYVENALRHGLLHKEGKKHLTIDFYLNADNIEIKIADNGIGRERSLEINKSRKKEHKSFALEAYNKRIELLNANRKNKLKLNILDEKNEYGKPLGTTVIITLPLDNEPNR